MKRHPIKIVLLVSGGLALSGMMVSAFAIKTHQKRLMYIAVALWCTGFLVANVPLVGFAIYRTWNKVKARWQRRTSAS